MVDMEPARDPDEGAPAPDRGPAASSGATAADRPTESPFPMNSRRLTSTYLKCIARAFGLPTKAAAEETRVIVEGKLAEMGRDPRNVLVVVATDSSGRETLTLRDVSGVFVDAGSPREEADHDSTDDEHGDVDPGSRGDRDESPPETPVHSDGDGIPDAEELHSLRAQNAELMATATDLRTEVSSLHEEVTKLRERLTKESERVNEMWRMNCAQVSGFDEAITAKDAEIEELRAKVLEIEGCEPVGPDPIPILPVVHVPSNVHGETSSVRGEASSSASTQARRGKAPPLSTFSGEDPECLLDDWLPSIERASTWNAWSEEDRLIQLAGHLKGRALQEWNLLRPDQRTTFAQAAEMLRSRLEPVSRAVAAQDFRHMLQREEESVSDFIRRLERTFRCAYGRDKMSSETRDMLLYGQMQEGLRLLLMRGPAVSGSKSYQELCVASKNEEKRLADLKRRQEYAQASKSHPTKSTVSIPSEKPRQLPGERSRSRKSFAGSPSSGLTNAPKHNNAARQDNGCFYCGKPGHLMKDCRQRRRESESRGPTRPATAKQIQSSAEDRDRPTQDPAGAELSDPPEDVVSSTSCPQTSRHIAHSSNEMAPNPYDLLLSSSEEEDEVKQVRVADSGSRSQLARVDIQGVPADGVVDTAADITIMGGKLFALVAASARLKKKDFRKPDKVPRSYDRRVFQLDGCMELDVTFEGTTLTTTVYIKMDAFDQLLLSEGVCRLLGIVTYHPSLVARRPRAHKEEVAPLVPSIRVHLVQSLKIPPNCSAAE